MTTNEYNQVMFQTFWSQYSLLSKTQKNIYILYIFVGSVLGLFDLMGVILGSIIGIFLIRSYFETSEGSFASGIISLLQFETYDSYTVVLLLTILTLFFFFIKTTLSLTLSRKLFRFLSLLEEDELRKLSRDLFEGKFEKLLAHGKQEIADTLTRGLSATFTNLFGQWYVIFSEIFVVTLMLICLIFIFPLFSMLFSAYFLMVLFIINRVLSPRIKEVNEQLTDLRNESLDLVINSLDLYREYKVYNSVSFAVKKITGKIGKYSTKYASDMWMQTLPKYILEIALLCGISLMLIAGKLFSIESDLLLLIIVFFMSSTRLLPSLLRIQSALYTLKGHNHLADSFISLRSEFEETLRENPKEQITTFLFSNKIEQEPFLSLENLSYSFNEEKGNEVVNNINLRITMGKKIAIVGPSGSGKSTLMDLLMGIIQPSSGNIYISKTPLKQWLSLNEKAISYLPQESKLVKGGLRENIAFAVDESEVDQDYLNKLVSSLGLSHLVEQSQSTRQSKDGYLSLSGGEIQRIGIARALYNKPTLLIMDEATSSLDANLEEDVLKSLRVLPNAVTLIMVAHRLSSVRNFDFLIYLEKGSVLGTGNFKELRNRVPQFDEQAKLLGL